VSKGEVNSERDPDRSKVEAKRLGKKKKARRNQCRKLKETRKKGRFWRGGRSRKKRSCRERDDKKKNPEIKDKEKS